MSHCNLWKLCRFVKVSDGPQTHILTILWLHKAAAQIHVPKRSQGFTPTQNMGRGFILCYKLLHNELSVSPIKWRDLLRVLCPVRKPVTSLDCILLKDKGLALVPRRGPEINSRACLWVLPRLRHRPQCWFTNHRLILFLRSCLETPKAG
jgi:hypothetical protein